MPVLLWTQLVPCVRSGRRGNHLPLRYCGREFSLSELQWIREAVCSDPTITRNRLSIRFCEQFNWKKPDGGLKDMSCRVAHLRMERDGLITLPAPRQGHFQRLGSIRRTPEGEAQPDITRKAGRFELSVQVVDARRSHLWNEYIDRYHYLGYTRLPGAQLRYFIRSDNQDLALLGFGAGAWKVSSRDRFIGWSDEQRQRKLHLVVNNARFLVLPWIHSRNLCSRILSAASKRIVDDWEVRYAYRPVLLETFVEKRRFRGTCYKASNWIHVGETKGRGKLDTRFQRKLPVKTVWMYPLDKSFRRVLSR